MTGFFNTTIGMSYGWAWFVATIIGILVIALAADAGGGDDHLCRPQDLGGDGAAAWAPNVVGTLRADAKSVR